MNIRIADLKDYEMVRGFYYRLIDEMKDAVYHPGWEKGVYPSDKYLRESVCRGELLIGVKDGIIIAAMIVDHECNESYSKIHWHSAAAPEEVMVIHALGVLPDYSGKGYAKQMVKHVLTLAEKRGQKAVRLDVLNGNVPALKLYSGMGFKYVGTVRMYYEDTGWTYFMLYEYPLTYIAK